MRNNPESVTNLVEVIASNKMLVFVPNNLNGPQNARERGLFYEERGRTVYQRTASHTQHKVELVARSLMISKSKPFLGACLDNIQKYQCSEGCLDSVVDINCPGNSKTCIQKMLF